MFTRSSLSQNSKYLGLSFVFFISLSLYFLNYLGLFTISDNIIYDGIVKHVASYSTYDSTVLLIDNDVAEHEVDLLKFLNMMQQYGAQQVLFTFLPRAVSPRFYQEAVRQGNVFFGRLLIEEQDNFETIMLEPFPEAVQGSKITWGVMSTPPSQQGVHRRQHVAFTLAGTTYPTLEILAAGALLGPTVALPKAPYLVNFHGGGDRLPRVTLSRVLKKGIVPELVQGRSVLLGEPWPRDSLHTPLDPQRVSLLTFRGFAVDTLLAARAITVSGALVQLGILVAMGLASLFLYQWLEMHLALWGTLVFVIAYGALVTVLLIYAHLWLPITEVVVAQGATFVAILYAKSTQRDLALRRMVLEMSSKLQERFSPASFYDSQEYWAQVVVMVRQTLDLGRLIFLERVAGDHRVREVIAWQCSLDDIYERRRDYERAPYSTAILENGLIKLEERLFFQHIVDTNEQYLIPLTFAGDVLGFWAFEIEPEKVANIPQFRAVIQDFASQIATLLHHRKQRLAQSQREQNVVQQYLRLEGGDQTSGALSRGVTLLERRLEGLDNVFAALDTATILYDLFGNVLQANKKMVELLHAAQLAPYNMTAIDLLNALCEVQAGEDHRLMRYVILEKSALSLPATLPSNIESRYMLHIKPVIRQQDNDSLEDTLSPFQIIGILYELINVTNIKNTYKIKADIIERIYFQVRNDLEAISLASSLLGKADISQEQHSRALQIMQGKVASTVHIIKDAMQHIQEESNAYSLESYPIDFVDMLYEAKKAIEVSEQQNDVGFILPPPKLISLVFATPGELTELLQTLLSILVHDAVKQTQITMHLEEKDQVITFECCNTGYGLPHERLQAYLNGSEEAQSEEFKRLQNAVSTVARWGGKLQASSEVGLGIHFIVQLRGFI